MIYSACKKAYEAECKILDWIFEKGELEFVNKIDLHPKVSFDHGFEVNHEELEKMHDRAHRYCFIANTLDSGVEVNINI